MLIKNKNIFAVVIGTALEYYDYVLYMHFIIILSPLFFPNKDPNVNLLLGFASFTIGYIARPLGGIIFGHIGDRIGRKKAISFAIIFSTIGTCSIGLLPTYAQIGILAPVLLIIFRCIQCISVGGEVIGAACYLIENSNKNNKCLMSSYINASSAIAGTVAGILGFLFTTSFMPHWA